MEKRTIHYANINAEQSGFPYAAQVLSVTREWEEKRKDKAPAKRQETRWFITSLSAAEADPKRLMALVRRHWSVENKNHWVRDSRTWEEDKCLHRKPRSAQNLALLRNTLLAVVPEERSVALSVAHYLQHPAQAVAALLKPLP